MKFLDLDVIKRYMQKRFLWRVHYIIFNLDVSNFDLFHFIISLCIDGYDLWGKHNSIGMIINKFQFYIKNNMLNVYKTKCNKNKMTNENKFSNLSLGYNLHNSLITISYLLVDNHFKRITIIYYCIHKFVIIDEVSSLHVSSCFFF